MSDVLEELAEEAEGKIDRAHVQRRVADWRQRVVDLYDDVSTWLPADFSTSRDHHAPMHEEMMLRYGVPSIELPILELFRAGEQFGKLAPSSLWIIGANGRLDLFVHTGHFLIVDRSENFSPQKWMIAFASNRRNEQQLTREALLRAIG